MTSDASREEEIGRPQANAWHKQKRFLTPFINPFINPKKREARDKAAAAKKVNQNDE